MTTQKEYMSQIVSLVFSSTSEKQPVELLESNLG